MTGSTAAEGAVKQVSELQLSGANLEPIKSLTLVAASRELFELTESAGQTFLSSELRKGTVAATDLGFISILSSAATSIPTSGEDIASIYYDLRAMCMAIDVSAMSALFLVLNPQRAKLMALIEDGTGGRAFPDMSWRGGAVAQIPAVVSDGIADHKALLVDAAQVAGETDAITLDGSEDAMLDMAGGGSPSYSLFQRSSVAIRSERFSGAQVLGSAACALLTNVSWGDGSTP
jgi:hypothetical protein